MSRSGIRSNIVCNILMGSLRAILFIGTLGLLILTLLLVYGLNHMPHFELIDQLYKQPFHSATYAVNLFNLIIIAVGIIGSLCQHKTSLRVFSFCTCFSALLVFIYTFCATSGVFQQARAEYLYRLGNYSQIYDWRNVRPSEPQLREATLTWDSWQYTFCCGFNGPEDWNRVRPKDIPSNLFPRSCCDLPREIFEDSYLCKETVNLAEEGCIARTDEYWRKITAYYCYLAVIQFLLAVLAWCINLDVSKQMSPQLSSISQQHILRDWPSRLQHEMVPTR